MALRAASQNPQATPTSTSRVPDVGPNPDAPDLFDRAPLEARRLAAAGQADSDVDISCLLVDLEEKCMFFQRTSLLFLPRGDLSLSPSSLWSPWTAVSCSAQQAGRQQNTSTPEVEEAENPWDSGQELLFLCKDLFRIVAWDACQERLSR